MNLPLRPARLAVCLWLLLPTGARSEPPPSAQLAAAQADKDDASVVEICRRALEKSPGDTALLREMFRAQIALKDTGRAAETLARLEKASAPAATLAELRGDLAYAGKGKFADAMAAWREALLSRPDDAPLLGKIADALDEHGSPDAPAALRAFLRVKPDHAARTARLAVWLLTTGHPDDADKAALAAGRLDAADDTVKAVAPVFDRLRPQLPVLRKLTERIAAARPGTATDAELDRALIYYRAGAYDAALADAWSVTANTGARNVTARLIEGQCLWRLNKPAEAAAVRVANLENVRWFDDARRCERLRAPDELSDQADAAATVRAYAARAVVLLDGNQPVLALEDAEKAIRTEENAGRRTADTEVVLAAALLRNDRPADARAAAQRATADDPRNPDGWALSGRLEQEAADFPAAVDHLTRALTIREDPAWLRRRETCLRVLGRHAEADRDARRATQLASNS